MSGAALAWKLSTKEAGLLAQCLAGRGCSIRKGKGPSSAVAPPGATVGPWPKRRSFLRKQALAWCLPAPHRPAELPLPEAG